ncbi:MAG TPA: hypothetical protein VNK81_03720 [Thermodesulfobacteriota bacterium]|jgi:hypothetical protein|nr:hypothetical protein [Thermodesulfobacteriota bacterium]
MIETKSHRILIPNSIFEFFVLLFTVFAISGCAAGYKTERDGLFYPVSNPDDFPEEITRLENIGRYHPDSSIRAKAHLRLAMLHLSHKNPNPDYRKALEELKIYVSMDTDGDKSDEAQSLIVLLKKLEKAQKENEERKRVIRVLTRENSILAEENQKMKETIKEMKSLDMQLEEKRKRVK